MLAHALGERRPIRLNARVQFALGEAFCVCDQRVLADQIGMTVVYGEVDRLIRVGDIAPVEPKDANTELNLLKLEGPQRFMEMRS